MVEGAKALLDQARRWLDGVCDEAVREQLQANLAKMLAAGSTDPNAPKTYGLDEVQLSQTGFGLTSSRP